MRSASQEENLAMTSSEYPNLINEAFIDPIRSVLIIDDEYPTWDKVLEMPPPSKNAWDSKKKQISGMIKAFRNTHPHMIVDIDDGELITGDEGTEISKHLTQSDLIVLDYELKDNGERSRNFINRLMKNDQFNLVVVHTENKELLSVFLEILIKLLQPIASIHTDFGDMVREGEQIKNRLDGGQDEKFEQLVDAIKPQEYIAFRKYFCMDATFKEAMDLAFKGMYDESKDELAGAGRILDAIENIKGNQKKNLLCHAMSLFEKKDNLIMPQEEPKRLKWSSSDPMWIRTDRGFITFASKKIDTNLIEVLKEALKDWNPNPTRLLSTKLRNEIRKKGVIAEDAALSNNFVQGRFFKNLQEKNEKHQINERHQIIESYMQRHFESLFQEIDEGVNGYTGQVLNAIDGDCQLKKRYGIDGVDGVVGLKRATSEYNAHISCIEPKADHLMTGHIFTVPPKNRGTSDSEDNALSSDADEEYWVCLSPPCDLVPGQNAQGIDDIGKKLKPFMAVRLTEQNLEDSKISDKTKSGNLIFINQNDVKALKFYKSLNVMNPQPEWRLFVAKNCGKFKSKMCFSLLRLGGQEGEFQFCETEATIVALLRPEYAISLAQKLGASMTRAGVEYLVD